MTLSSLVVSRDWQEVSVLECILGGLQIDVDIEPRPDRAQAKLSNSKVDALIVDWDLSGSDRLVDHLQQDSHWPQRVPLVLMSGPCARRELDATGALFTFEKPISVEQAVRTLSAARNLILDGRLRYHRHNVDIPVSLSWKGCKVVHAELMNLSQGGVGVHVNGSIACHEPITVSFRLPGTRTTVRAHGELAWTDGSGRAGIRFVDLAPRQQRGLHLWLARQYFA
jgi:PilZ domain-containing protein